LLSATLTTVHPPRQLPFPTTHTPIWPYIILAALLLLGYTTFAFAAQTHTLKWTNPPPDAEHSPATTIEIFRRASNSTEFGFVKAVSPDTTTAVLTLPGTAPSDRHCYRIRAINAAGPSPLSNEACTTIASPPPDIFTPHTPTGLTATIN